jgi:dienelactone hydrolase
MHVLDLLFGLAARGPLFFSDGWGDRALCESMDPVALSRQRIPHVAMTLGPPKTELGGVLREGAFESPETRLPACARTAHVRLLLPEREVRAVVVHLAASGDQGFGVRLRFAAPLLERGIGALVLENAFYGARRPANQPHHAVRSVSDLHLMGAATFQEGRALLRWLREDLAVPDVGVTGFSMGGQLSAMVGASMPFPCAVVPMAPTCSPDSVLRDGVLSHVADWVALAAGAEPDAARSALCEHLSRFSVTTLPPPACREAAIVVGTAGDGVVPPSEMRRIAQHWGCELRWIDAGHVSAVLRHQGEMREALADALERLHDRCGKFRRSGRARRRVSATGPRAPGAPAFSAVRARRRAPAEDPRT